jgi:RHS repeat-associated protein
MRVQSSMAVNWYSRFLVLSPSHDLQSPRGDPRLFCLRHRSSLQVGRLEKRAECVTLLLGFHMRTGISNLTYTFDALGQLRQATGGTGTVNVDYDPSGMLRRLTQGGINREFLYDGSDLLVIYDSGTVLRRFVHGAGVDEPLVSYTGSGLTNKTWFHADERGSIIAASNGSGTATSSVRYTTDGESGALVSPFGYTGQFYLPELQLYYYKARMYSPKTGRFLQPDPIGYAGGMNLYSYVGSDPINRTDPAGLCSSWSMSANTRTWSTSIDGGGGASGTHTSFSFQCEFDMGRIAVPDISPPHIPQELLVSVGPPTPPAVSDC